MVLNTFKSTYVIIFYILFSEYVCISVLNIGRSLHGINIISIHISFIKYEFHHLFLCII